MALAAGLGACGCSCACELHVREKFGAARVGPRAGGETGSSRSLEASRQQLQVSPAPEALDVILRAGLPVVGEDAALVTTLETVAALLPLRRPPCPLASRQPRTTV